jgi:hypothetical protein
VWTSKHVCAQVAPQTISDVMPSAYFSPGGGVPHVRSTKHCAQELPQGVSDVIWSANVFAATGSPHFLVQHAPTSAGVAQTAAAHSTSAAALLYTLPEPQKPDFDAMVEHLALALQHAVTSLAVDEEQAVPAQRASAAALL